MGNYIQTIRGFAAADKIPAASLQILAEVALALTDSGSPWTPNLVNTGYSLGNGTAVGAYWRANGMTMISGTITFGSTTNFGSGQYTMDLPVSFHAGTNGGAGILYFFDVSAQANSRPGALTLSSSSRAQLWSTGGVAAPTSPFALATGDVLYFAYQYGS